MSLLRSLRLRKKIDPEIIIDLSLGSPDSPTPDPILKDLLKAAQDINNHGYPRFNGKETLLEEICAWYQRRFGIQISQDQTLPLLGSKEGLAHLPLAYLDPGDLSLIPNPHYPVHYRGSIIAGAEVYDMPLRPENGFLPNLKAIPESIAQRAKFMIISYPNNPTGAIASPEFMQELVAFVRKYNILLCHDLAYSELGFGSHTPQSIFEYMSLDEPAIEFFTFSKTYHMAGWRIGFCVGNQDIVQNLYRFKTNLDYGVSGTIQDAAISALNMPDEYYAQVKALYEERSEAIYHELSNNLDWEIFRPGGAMYLWIPAPAEHAGSGREFAMELLTELGIVTTPGVAFGSEGARYTRIALVQPKEKLIEAAQRIIKHYS